MIIKWHNILALVLAIFAIHLLFTNSSPIKSVLSTMGSIGPGHTSEELTMGLICLGLVLVSLVAIVRLLTRNDGD